MQLLDGRGSLTHGATRIPEFPHREGSTRMASIEQQSVLHFSIGPVQDFIETARTTRDLWTGSYILSWLTARAAAAVLDERGTLVPECLRDAPLVKFHRGQREQDRAHLLSSSLPNTFAFIAPGADGEGPRVAVENAVRAEWKNIADAVHEELNGKFRDLADGAGWDVH